MSAQVETWRVNTAEGVFETDLDTLKQWISEGAVLSTDKVSKGSLGWIDAGRAPVLRAAFAGEVCAPAPVPVSEPAVASALTEEVPSANAFVQPAMIPPHPSTAPTSADFCYNHAQLASKHVCRGCGAGFCDECPKFIGTSKIPLCPLCGDLCSLVEKLQHKAARHELQSSGFGFGDFGRALIYPWQHKISLVFGAGLYGFLLLAGFKGWILASVVMFGCIAQVISQVAWGRMNRDFMPDYSAFAMLDDVVVPVGMGIAITIVSWGPTIVLVIAFLFGILGGKTPSPMQLLQGPDAQSEAPIDSKTIGVLVDPNGDPAAQEEASKKLDQIRPGSQISQEAERSKKQLSEPGADIRFLTSFVLTSIPFLVLLLLSVCWAIFYYPMALAVAGYTQSFTSIINPLVGLDTIRRMGGTYFKAFGMVLAIQLVSLILGGIVAVITAPFAMPFFGNLPATFINGTLTFYFNLVIACVLGLSLYKSADRLGIEVD